MSTETDHITVGESIFASCVALVLSAIANVLILLIFPDLEILFLFLIFPMIFGAFYLPAQSILQRNKADRKGACERGTWEVD
ncbi:MAG: hypothetical protein OXC80_14770 [Gammaproteobacteria bacterium]|nr:hypothetical protein [Gammaproteobacteria bacterium]